MQRRTFLATSLALTGSALALSLSETGAAEPAAPGGAPTADAVGHAVQRFYDAAQTFQSEFKQRYWIEAFGTYRDSRGTVLFSKPGKMRWAYSNNGTIVVSNGKELKVYEKENKQMYLQTVNETQYPAALSFLLGTGSLSNTFDLQLLDPVKLQFPGGYVLMGTPKAATPAYQKILFYVDKQTYQVRRVLLFDAQRNRNRFDFENAKVNMQVDPKMFTYNPPQGTRVIKP
jgi:outer membrane lipoprotein carrier protein